MLSVDNKYPHLLWNSFFLKHTLENESQFDPLHPVTSAVNDIDIDLIFQALHISHHHTCIIILPCKAKRQYLFMCKVSRYYLLALRGSILLCKSEDMALKFSPSSNLESQIDSDLYTKPVKHDFFNLFD